MSSSSLPLLHQLLLSPHDPNTDWQAVLLRLQEAPEEAGQLVELPTFRDSSTTNDALNNTRGVWQTHVTALQRALRCSNPPLTVIRQLLQAFPHAIWMGSEGGASTAPLKLACQTPHPSAELLQLLRQERPILIRPPVAATDCPRTANDDDSSLSTTAKLALAAIAMESDEASAVVHLWQYHKNRLVGGRPYHQVGNAYSHEEENEEDDEEDRTLADLLMMVNSPTSTSSMLSNMSSMSYREALQLYQQFTTVATPFPALAVTKRPEGPPPTTDDDPEEGRLATLIASRTLNDRLLARAVHQACQRTVRRHGTCDPGRQRERLAVVLSRVWYAFVQAPSFQRQFTPMGCFGSVAAMKILHRVLQQCWQEWLTPREILTNNGDPSPPPPPPFLLHYAIGSGAWEDGLQDILLQDFSHALQLREPYPMVPLPHHIPAGADADADAEPTLWFPFQRAALRLSQGVGEVSSLSLTSVYRLLREDPRVLELARRPATAGVSPATLSTDDATTNESGNASMLAPIPLNQVNEQPPIPINQILELIFGLPDATSAEDSDSMVVPPNTIDTPGVLPHVEYSSLIHILRNLDSETMGQFRASAQDEESPTTTQALLEQYCRPPPGPGQRQRTALPHALAAQPLCSVHLLRVVHFYEPQLFTRPDDAQGRLPLHYVVAGVGHQERQLIFQQLHVQGLSHLAPLDNDDGNNSGPRLPYLRRLHWLVETFPESCRVCDAQGQWPLHLAAESQLCVTGLQLLIHAWPGGLYGPVQRSRTKATATPQESTRARSSDLPPVLAGAAADLSLDGIWTLLRAAPDVLTSSCPLR